MRILHTADWHLGCTIGAANYSRTQEQAAFLNWLLQTIEQQSVDVLVIAGDVFDQMQPSAEAQELYYGFLAAAFKLPGLRRTVVVGGNHDSASRLDAPDGVLRELQITVVGGYWRNDDVERYLVPVAGADGRVEVVVAAVPFVHSWRLGITDRAEQGDLAKAFSTLYSTLADVAQERWPGAALLATGHLTCARDRTLVDGHSTDDEHVGKLDAPQEIHMVGTLGALPPSIFDQRYQYVALGHIHRAYPVERPRVWYSGTPVPVNFAEGASPRRVLLVDMENGALKQVQPVEVPMARVVMEVRGDAESVRTTLCALPRSGTLPPLVSIVLESPQLVLGQHDAMERFLDKQFVDSATRPLIAAWREVRPPSETKAVDTLPTQQEQPSPEQIFRQAWIAKYKVEPDAQIMQAFSSLLTNDNL
jgi:exonuclease SbcD